MGAGRKFSRGAKRPRRCRNGERKGYPLFSQLGGLDSVVSSPIGVQDGTPAENKFGSLFSFTKHFWRNDDCPLEILKIASPEKCDTL